MSELKAAKESLCFYLAIIARAAGIRWGADDDAQIKGVVDAIVNAAIQQHDDLLAERDRLLHREAME